jgi:hypothetical protein
LVSYLIANTRNITEDDKTQSAWLAPQLRKEFTQNARWAKERQKRLPDIRTDAPGNDTFLNAWDAPTAYSILGSRSYADYAIVDVEFKWGAGTNYAGSRRLASFIFHRDAGLWRLDDRYSYRNEFSPQPNSLSQHLSTMPD